MSTAPRRLALVCLLTSRLALRWSPSGSDDGTSNERMDSAARLILQVKDGSGYGVRGFHKVLVRRLEKLQFNDKGIFIPELNILVPSQDVVAVSAP